MQIEQRVKADGSWRVRSGELTRDAQLTLVFGATDVLRDPATWVELSRMYPHGRIVACSTAGTIAGVHVHDDTIAATSIALDNGTIEVATVAVSEDADSARLGAVLAKRVPSEGLVHVMVLSDGMRVNGSALVKGLAANLPPHVAVTGGLSGDGPRFERTAVCVDGPDPSEQVVAVAFYGSRLEIGYGSLGGWDPFGPERRVTRSEGNILYELDGEPALDLYKRYLGPHAAELPGSALLFPLAIRAGDGDDTPIVRTIISVDERAKSMTFVGDIPTGFRARLMRTNFTGLVDGASAAAATSVETIGKGRTQLAVLVSCVGRRTILKQRTEEELEAVEEMLGGAPVMTGFYSYGEIAPFGAASRCELHNQTMTITVLTEN
jgi:hypothetical protein